MSNKYPLIEDDEWNAMPIRQKLQHYIGTTSTSVDEFQDCRTRHDFWSDILGINYSGYNSLVDEDVIRVLEIMTDGHLVPSQCSTHDELISYIVCNAGLGDYGTSPRGAWIDYSIKDLMPAAIARWRQDWDEPPEDSANASQ